MVPAKEIKLTSDKSGSKPKDTISFSIEANKLGYAGLAYELVDVPTIKGDERTDHQKLNDPEPRIFEIRAVLSREGEGIFSRHLNLNSYEPKGSSFIGIPEKAIKSKFDSEFGVFHFEKNQHNEVSHISMEVRTNSKATAIKMFHLAVNPVLDYLAFVANIPVPIERIICRDVKNEIFWVSYKAPYQTKTISPGNMAIRKALSPIYALYREAKNNSSPHYRFLCFFKILEGIYTRLRPNVFSDLKSKGVNVKSITEKENVPGGLDMERYHKDYINKPIKPLYDNEFQKEFRVQIAHFAEAGMDASVVTDHDEIVRVERKLLLIEQCVRTVIATQEKYIAILAKAEGKA